MALYSSQVIWDQHKEPALSAPLVTFTNQQQDTIHLPFELPNTVGDYSIEEILAIAKEANIIDDLDGEPLYEKLAAVSGKENLALAINAVDDEPYLSSKTNPLLTLREEVVGGIALCQKITGAPTENVHILVYRHLGEIESNIPSHLEKYQVTRLSGGYPARPSIRQLRGFRNRSFLHIGVGAVVHLYRAVYFLKKQTTSFVTVHGNAVANPMNLEVSFDMTVTQVLERCGLIQTPTRVVLGGSMTGITVLDTDRTRITPTSGAVLALTRRQQEFRYACIGCGRCERTCPMGLNPMYIYRFMESGYHKKLAYYDPAHCIGCGMCSYVCPSRLPVSVEVLEAKKLALAGEIPTPVPELTWQQVKNGAYRVLLVLGRGIAALGRGTKIALVALWGALVWLALTVWKGAKAFGRGAGRLWKFLLRKGKALGEHWRSFREKQEETKSQKAAKSSKPEEPSPQESLEDAVVEEDLVKQTLTEEPKIKETTAESGAESGAESLSAESSPLASNLKIAKSRTVQDKETSSSPEKSREGAEERPQENSPKHQKEQEERREV